MSSTDQYGRRTWNLDEYQRTNSGDEESTSKEKEEGPKPKAALKGRDEKIDLESSLGKTVIINRATPSSQAGGFHCDVCDCVVKDSINYLDHINGKKHQRNLGMTLKVKRSTLDDVNARFEASLKKKQEVKKEYDVNERMRELKEEEERIKEYRKEKKKEKKNKKRKEVEIIGDDEDNDEMATLMGFGSFQSKKKK